MSEVEIEIDVEVINVEIAYLSSLRKNACQAPPFLESKGKTIEEITEVFTCLDSLAISLDDMIGNTISFLENAKDSMIDVDEKSAKVLEDLLKEGN